MLTSSRPLQRATVWAIGGLSCAWYFDVENTLGSDHITSFLGYTLFWLTYISIGWYFFKSIHHKHKLSPIFPSLPKRRASVFDAIAETSNRERRQTSPDPIGSAAKPGFELLRRASAVLEAFSKPVPLTRSRIAATEPAYVKHRTKSIVYNELSVPPNPYLFRSRTAAESPQITLDSSEDEDRSYSSEHSLKEVMSACSTGCSDNPEFATSLISCSSIDVKIGNPAEMLSGLSLLLLMAFVITTHSVYGWAGAFFIGTITGLGMCNLAETFKVISEPVTLRWILTLAVFHSLHFRIPRIQIFPLLDL
eukprot:Protomagalhaensia_sp_Gyna_25__5446@NODE_713_length_2790_cov_347_884406_g555_i0_p2_GENE_NODE_713_length_2790_cov_347_884406_g555_i0NODE_713_length_2790_cov_347_884406_g555_i0_p2_ORF_typecomplete_len307_score40_10FA_hydroxylase/PF04116_13/2_5e02FA_hydroxylase/PF04116_13/0_081Glyco_transf_11/PF01531_16/0_1_NODE_713_length_2790_cov_347_884406_g555_i030950